MLEKSEQIKGKEYICSNISLLCPQLRNNKNLNHLELVKWQRINKKKKETRW